MRTVLPKTPGKEEKNKLVEQYLPLVQHIVGRLSVALPPHIEREDLFSSGILGLIHASESYDSAKGASFKTYAYTTIRGAILDELRRQDPIPRSARERIRKLERAHRELTHTLCRSPTREELSEKLGCSLEELDQDLMNSSTAQILSIDDAGEGSESLSGSLPSEQLLPFQAVEKEEAIDILTKEIGNLPEQARQVVILYYHEGLLLKEIGDVMGVSESRVCQILSKALAMLRLALKR